MPNIEILNICGLNVRSYRAGQGTPLLFLHGASGLPVWGPFFDALADRFDVRVLEHPGFGSSDLPDWIQSTADIAMHYLDVLDELGLEALHLVGNSLGGWVASELAVRDCARLASLTLISPAGTRPPSPPPGNSFNWGPQETVQKLFFDQGLVQQILSRPPTPEEAALMARSRAMAERLGKDSTWLNPTLAHWLRRIDVPTQIIWGSHDNLFPASYAAFWGAHIPGSKVAIINEAGHLPHAEKAAQTSACIIDAILSR